MPRRDGELSNQSTKIVKNCKLHFAKIEKMLGRDGKNAKKDKFYCQLWK